jgi:hypothetical protein
VLRGYSDGSLLAQRTGQKAHIHIVKETNALWREEEAALVAFSRDWITQTQEQPRIVA